MTDRQKMTNRQESKEKTDRNGTVMVRKKYFVACFVLCNLTL